MPSAFLLHETLDLHMILPVLLLLVTVLATAHQETGGRAPLPSGDELSELPPDGGPGFNRLVFEKSPYLRQHARNPVDWYPWGAEAFERARDEDRPVFLSIGYSTCHWCHVMEHESFEDQEVADLLNASFVCVKVDREERPDLDAVYMQVTQAMTGSGGWPMTVVLTPDKKPFFAGTYFPRTARFGRKGMLELLPDIARAWKERRDDVLRSAGEITRVVRESLDEAPGALERSTLTRGLEQLARSHDAERGGFGSAPKFPVPHQLLFLLQVHGRDGDEQALAMVERTLDAMRAGGVYDQVGFGFHRYSTDREWLVPHFEKMLYDQALHVMAYTAAHQVSGRPEYRATAQEVIEYVLRDLADPGGGFHSAEDADSEGEEGRFYLWKRAEVLDVLGPDEGALFARVFEITEEGNFLEESTRQRSGRSIPHRTRSLASWAAELALSEDALATRLEAARGKLLEVRSRRIRPLKDDKILCDWNGLMIAALARAAAAFEEPRYLAAAERAARFCLEHLRTPEGRLHKRWRDGEAAFDGTLEDHAFLAWGLLELYEAGYDSAHLAAALELCETMIEHFEDAEKGGFFTSADDAEALLFRHKDAYDGALPSGNSVAAWVLLRLARMTGREELEACAERTLKAFGSMAQRPAAHTLALLALDFALGPSFEVVVAGRPDAEDTRALLRVFSQRYAPHVVRLLRPPGEAPPITRLAPFTLDQTPLEGRARAFVCRDFACRAPTTDPVAALAALDPASWD
jgi:uncharacterized protein YyaL (SSP411 family)